MKSDEVASIIGYSAGWVRKITRHYNESGSDGIKDRRKDNEHELLVSKEKINIWHNDWSPGLTMGDYGLALKLRNG